MCILAEKIRRWCARSHSVCNRSAAARRRPFGDLTQRARVKQFQQVQQFLDALPPTRIVVPGNHDISAANLLERVARPLSRYRRYITEYLEPYYADEEITIVGLNTVRVLSRKNRRINQSQVASACARFDNLDPELIRVVVTHHPLDLVESDPESLLVGRAAMAMSGFAQCKVDLFLSGHLHAGKTVASSARYTISGYSAIVAHADTAVSTRTRGEANSWNLIRSRYEGISLQRMVWNPDSLRLTSAGRDPLSAPTSVTAKTLRTPFRKVAFSHIGPDQSRQP